MRFGPRDGKSVFGVQKLDRNVVPNLRRALVRNFPLRAPFCNVRPAVRGDDIQFAVKVAVLPEFFPVPEKLRDDFFGKERIEIGS